MDIDELIKHANQALTTVDSDKKVVQLEIDLIICHTLNADRSWIRIHGDHIPTLQQKSKILTMIKNRASGIPIAYLLGYKEFYGRNFVVTKNTLVPRPASEGIIDYIKSLHLINPAILDVGTGSGCLAITAAIEITESIVTATDKYAKCISVAAKNSKNYKTNIRLIKSDLLKEVDTKFDLIIANLPYIDSQTDLDPSVLSEPRSSLISSDRGLFLIKKLIRQIDNKKILRQNCELVLESEPESINDITFYAKKHGFLPKHQNGLISSYIYV
jgi:release factor glutamine methyltransferase